MSLRPASRPRPDKEKIKVQVLQKVFFDGHTQKSPNSIGMPTIRCSEPYSCAQCGKAVVDVNMDSDSSMLRTLLSDEFSAFKFRDFFFDGRRIRRFFDHHTASTSSGLQTIHCSASEPFRTLLLDHSAESDVRERFSLMGAHQYRRRIQGFRPRCVFFPCGRSFCPDGCSVFHPWGFLFPGCVLRSGVCLVFPCVYRHAQCESARPGVCPWSFGAPQCFFSASISRAPHRWVDSRRLLATPSI